MRILKQIVSFRNIITLLFLLSHLKGLAQIGRMPLFSLEKNHEIQELSITDSLLEKRITDYIDSLTLNDSIFKKYGYLSLTEIKSKEKERCFHLNRKYYYFFPGQTDQMPLFYCWVRKRLVLVFTNDRKMIQQRLQKKSEKKIIKLINSTLPEIKYEYIEDPITHQKKKLIPTGMITLENGSINFCMDNGK